MSRKAITDSFRQEAMNQRDDGMSSYRYQQRVDFLFPRLMKSINRRD